MATYRIGSTGREVLSIQQRLRELGLYRGPLDGSFGGGTESAVVAFQGSAKLEPDGRVGDITWWALFASANPPGATAGSTPATAPAPAVTAESLPYRCLALTGSIETSLPPPECFSAVVGDFDGQGMSFGAIQFALRSGSLGEFLRELDKKAPGLLDGVFHLNAAILRNVLAAPADERVAWAQSIQHIPRHLLDEPWNGMFKALGRAKPCQDLQVEMAGRRFFAGIALCREYGLWSERAAALMFDIKVQNGSIADDVKAQIERDFAGLGGLDRERLEIEKMRVVARRRAAACSPRWVPAVLARKMTIATGEGLIHGRHYDLAADYGIRLVEIRSSL